jgi:hypothetical protein
MQAKRRRIEQDAEPQPAKGNNLYSLYWTERQAVLGVRELGSS